MVLSTSCSDLISLFSEVYVALDYDLRVLAAIGIRTVFDMSAELLGIDPSLQFWEKLNAFRDSGKIGQEERYSRFLGGRWQCGSPQKLATRLATIITDHSCPSCTGELVSASVVES